MEYTKKLFANSDGAHARFLVSLGDVNHSFDDFKQEYFETYLKSILPSSKTAPCVIPVRGNHEWRGQESSDFTRYFDTPYRAISAGNTCLIVLDTGEDKSPSPKSPYTMSNVDTDYMAGQKKWLQELVKSDAFQKATFRIVLAHGPAVILSPKSYMGKAVEQLAGDLFLGEHPAHQIHLWLSGHVHTLLRYLPDTNEIRSIANGKDPKLVKIPTPESNRIARFPVVTLDGPGNRSNPLSSAQIQVGNDLLTVRCFSLSGNVLDAFTINPKGEVMVLPPVK